MNKRWYF